MNKPNRAKIFLAPRKSVGGSKYFFAGSSPLANELDYCSARKPGPLQPDSAETSKSNLLRWSCSCAWEARLPTKHNVPSELQPPRQSSRTAHDSRVGCQLPGAF